MRSRKDLIEPEFYAFDNFKYICDVIRMKTGYSNQDFETLDNFSSSRVRSQAKRVILAIKDWFITAERKSEWKD